ncbi:MAG: hypothetical protein IT488_09345 [Gammaproteobacteria bacterium]|nr:hypothetical protein [Gammaproteobacteria bacterium]
MTPEERENKIVELIQKSGLSRESAALAVAIEAGDVSGDIFIENEGTSEKPTLHR